MGGKEIYYWDTCIILALLKREQRDDPNILLGIQEQAKLFDEEKIDIATSTISIAEILPHHRNNPAGILERFLEITEHKNFHFIEVSRRIVVIANEIRDYIYDGINPNLDIPDAIHLASAISLNCSCIYTLDGTRVDRKGLGLLQVKRPVAGKYDIQISKPSPKLPPELPGIN